MITSCVRGRPPSIADSTLKKKERRRVHDPVMRVWKATVDVEWRFFTACRAGWCCLSPCPIPSLTPTLKPGSRYQAGGVRGRLTCAPADTCHLVTVRGSLFDEGGLGHLLGHIPVEMLRAPRGGAHSVAKSRCGAGAAEISQHTRWSLLRVTGAQALSMP